MTTWLENEERTFSQEIRHSKIIGIHTDKKFVWAFFLLLCLIASQLLAVNEIAECPYCQNPIELKIEAKEIPGAGWICENCGHFQSNLTYCTMCGNARYKK